MKIEINKQFKQALQILDKSNKNLFITGKAGTGKSTLLEHFRNITDKLAVILAPTGVAALNVNGETIHSFFGFKPDITLDKIKVIKGKKREIYKMIDLIIIDEISMVRADLLDCIDKFMKLNGKSKNKPFGGVQMAFFGDLYQLPPVVTSKEKELFKSHYETPYFFSAKVFNNFSMEFIELEKIYRQKETQFIDLLNSIRNNSITKEQLDVLNQRTGKELVKKDNEYIIHLTTTNKNAKVINDNKLAELNNPIKTYIAEITRDFKESSYPTDKELNISVGSQIMLLNNDVTGRWVNGSLGEIIKITKDKETKEDIIHVHLSTGKNVKVKKFTWEVFHFQYNSLENRIESNTLGIFTQYPLKVAWAVTIHKSQGKTFNKVIVDMGKGSFAHGQTYVALSRCVSFDGISFIRPIKKSDIWMDWKIVNFITKYQYSISDKELPFEQKLKIIKDAINNKLNLKITYLKASDVKSKRIIKPLSVKDEVYMGKTFPGLKAFCLKRNDQRMFRVDRILEITVDN